jgi:hypothetical protein
VGLEVPGAPKNVSQTGTSSYAPYPAILDESPLASTPLPLVPFNISRAEGRAMWERPDAQIVFTPQQPVAHFRRELEFHNVRLAKYVLPEARYELRAYP